MVNKGVILLHNLALGQYCPCNSIIHRLDPRTKFLTLIPLILATTFLKTAASRNIFIIVGLFFFLAFLVGLSKVPVTLFLRQLRPFIWIVGVTFILHAFLTDDTVGLKIPVIGFNIAYEGLYLGLFFGLRLLLIISFSLVLMFTTAPAEMTNGIEKLLRPLKRIGWKTDKYALMLGITLRFIPVLFEEGDRIRKAQISRGAHFEGSIYSRMHSLASIVIPLFISVFKRAEVLALALEARGYPGKGNRTYYRDLRLKLADLGAFFIVFIITSGVFLL